jgi:hypothetical protein
MMIILHVMIFLIISHLNFHQSLVGQTELAELEAEAGIVVPSV